MTRDTAWSGPAEQNAPTSRESYAASARGGVLIGAAPRVVLALGGGAGVTSGSATRHFSGTSDDIDQGGAFFEALADASFGIGGEVDLIAGMAVRYRLLSPRDREDPLDTRVPAVMPNLTGELRVGAGWSFGGGK